MIFHYLQHNTVFIDYFYVPGMLVVMRPSLQAFVRIFQITRIFWLQSENEHPWITCMVKIIINFFFNIHHWGYFWIPYKHFFWKYSNLTFFNLYNWYCWTLPKRRLSFIFQFWTIFWTKDIFTFKLETGWYQRIVSFFN